jgi:hypothetical protein
MLNPVKIPPQASIMMLLIPMTLGQLPYQLNNPHQSSNRHKILPGSKVLVTKKLLIIPSRQYRSILHQ